MNKNMLTVIVSVLLSGLTALGIVKANQPETPETSTTTTYSIDGSAYRTVNLAQDKWPDFTYAAESAVDAVVFVKVTVKTTQQYFDPFSFFFGNPTTPQSRERVQQGSGSGVIIREDGYIVTNNHVVQGATEIEVTLNNNKTYKATVVGTDAATDVALIKINANALPIVPMGDSDKLRLGEWVLAIFYPDRCCRKSRQFGRSPCEQGRGTSRHQYRNRITDRCVFGLFLCGPVQHSQENSRRPHRLRKRETREAWSGYESCYGKNCRRHETFFA